MHKIFRNPIFSETQKGCTTTFLVLSDTDFDEKSVIQTRLFLSITFFDTRNFLWHRRVVPRPFSVLREKNFDKKLWYTPLFSYPKNVLKAEYFWSIGGFPYEIFRYCETKTWTKKRDTNPSFLIHNIFRYQKFSETQKGCPTKISVLWDIIFDKKLWYNPSFLIHNIFRYQKFSETKEGSPTKFFGTVRQRLWQKIVIQPPLLLSKKFCETRNFLKHRSVFPRNFLVHWDTKLSTDSSEVPLLSVNFFDTGFFLKHRRVLFEKFRYCETQTLTKKVWYTPLFSYT